MSFASVLKDVRELRRMSQSDLARATGMTPAAINHMEAGRREPSIGSLRKLAVALNITPSTLLETQTAHPVVCTACNGKGVQWVRHVGRDILR